MSPLTNPSFQLESTNCNAYDCNKNKNTNSININSDNINTEAALKLLQLPSVSSAILAKGSKTWKKRKNSSMEGVKEIWLTSSQAQQQRVKDKKIKQNKKEHSKKHASFTRKRKKTVLVKKKSAQVVCDEVGKKSNNLQHKVGTTLLLRKYDTRNSKEGRSRWKNSCQ